MKYTVLINQSAIFEFGFCGKTDFTDWSIIDYIQHWQTNPKAEKYDDMVWINYKHLIEEMPLLNIKTKGAISTRLKKLFDLNLIDVHKQIDNRIFVKITELTHEIINFRNVVKCSPNQTPVHEIKQGVHQTKQGVHEIKHSTDNHLTDHQDKKRESKPKETPKSTETRKAYERAYLKRYGVSPLGGAKINTLLCQFVDQVGKDDAPLIAEYYVWLNDKWFQTKAHDVATMLQNAQAIRTQWATGTNKTSIDYRNQERTSNNQSVQQRIEQRIMAGEL